MKKAILTVILTVFSIITFAQSFNGVPISGDLNTAIARFKAKGFTFEKFVEIGAIMNGKVANQPIELYIIVTPKTKQVYKMTVYFQESKTWFDIKNKYNEYVSLFTEKYGEPSGEYKKFAPPYEEGDGYEMSALGLGKIQYFTLWIGKDNLNLAVEISEYKQVKLVYENEKLAEIKQAETDAMKRISF
jgi:hypothetical protein